MPSATTQKQRARLFMAQNGKCHYCGCDMILMMRVPPDFRPANLCTLEHLDHSYSPDRGQHNGTRRHVAACSKCNLEQSVAVERANLELHRAKSQNGRGSKYSTQTG